MELVGKKIAVSHLTVKFGGTVLFDDFSVEFEAGTTTGILAPSGSGKTTLLNEIAEREIAAGRKVSFIFQEPRLIDGISILENIALPLKNEMKSGDAYDKAGKILDKMGLGNKKNERPTKMSGGEKQRVSIARALAFPSETILMDEAFQSLDKETKKRVMDFAKETIERERRTAILVTHDEAEARELCGKILTLGNHVTKA